MINDVRLQEGFHMWQFANRNNRLTRHMVWIGCLHHKASKNGVDDGCCSCFFTQGNLEWSKSLRNFPKVSLDTISKWLETGGKKNAGEKSYKFFREGYVYDVYTSTSAVGESLVKARCYRSLCKKEEPHYLVVKMNQSALWANSWIEKKRLEVNVGEKWNLLSFVVNIRKSRQYCLNENINDSLFIKWDKRERVSSDITKPSLPPSFWLYPCVLVHKGTKH